MTFIITISLLLSFFPAVSISHGGELGDAITSDESRDIFFASLDNNGNGKITVDELTGYIEGTGGNSLDEMSEIQSAVSSVLKTLDLNEDKILKKDDFAVYWKSLSSLLSVEEVADWVEHALLMPAAVVNSFIDNAITGYDFMELLANNGALLENELDIPRITTRRRLIRGIKMKLLGMGSPPSRPYIPQVLSTERSTCFTHLYLSWLGDGVMDGDDTADAFPVHRYQLQRQTASPQGVVGNQRAPWVTVYEGPDTSAIDTLYTPPVAVANDLVDNLHSPPPQLYTYRICAWNMIGRSELVYLKYELAATMVDLSRGGVATDCESLAQPILSEYYTHTGSATRIRPGSEPGLDVHSVVSTETPPVSVDIYRTGDSDNSGTPIFGRSSSSTNVTTDSPQSIFSVVWSTLWAIAQAFLAGSSMLFTAIQVLAFVITAVISYIRLRSLWRYRTSSGTQRQHRAMAASNLSCDDAVMWFVDGVFVPFINLAAPAVVSFFQWIGGRYPMSLSTTKNLAEMVLSLQRMVKIHITEYPTTEQLPVPTTARQPSNTSTGYYSSGDEGPEEGEDAEEGGENYKSCSICQKNFKLKLSKLKWRKRHRCCRCLNVFCSRCGIVTHNKFLQCPVPGTCKCMKCAGIAGQANTQVEGIAVPHTHVVGGSAQHGVGVVSTAALEMHNKAVPPADFRATSGSDDAYPIASSFGGRTASLHVNCDAPLPERVPSGSSNSHSGIRLTEMDLSKSFRDSAVTAGLEESAKKYANGTDLPSRGNKPRNHSFGSLRHLMSFQDVNSDSTVEGAEKPSWRGTGLIGSSSPITGRKAPKGLPPKPPSSSSGQTPAHPGASPFQSMGNMKTGGGVRTPSPPASPVSSHRDNEDYPSLSTSPLRW